MIFNKKFEEWIGIGMEMNCKIYFFFWKAEMLLEWVARKRDIYNKKKWNS